MLGFLSQGTAVYAQEGAGQLSITGESLRSLRSQFVLYTVRRCPALGQTTCSVVFFGLCLCCALYLFCGFCFWCGSCLQGIKWLHQNSVACTDRVRYRCQCTDAPNARCSMLYNATLRLSSRLCPHDPTDVFPSLVRTCYRHTEALSAPCSMFIAQCSVLCCGPKSSMRNAVLRPVRRGGGCSAARVLGR